MTRDVRGRQGKLRSAKTLARELFRAPHEELSTAAVIRQMRDAGETTASIRATTGASRQAVYAALRASDTRGRPIARSKDEAVVDAARVLGIELAQGKSADELELTSAALRKALEEAYDSGVRARRAAARAVSPRISVRKQARPKTKAKR